MYSKKTEWGEITISQSVFGKIVTEAAEPFGNRLQLCNAKGKSVSSSDSGSFLEISEENGRPVLKVYVLIRFGAGITRITKGMIETIGERTEALLGVSPESISVIVKGVFSKNVAKRNIEVTKE